MLKDAQKELKGAVYNKLTTTTYLVNNNIGVFDSVPKDRAVPFVTIGDMTVVNDSTQGVPLQTISFVIHTWDEGRSGVRLMDTMAAVLAALDDAFLTLGNPFTHISTQFVSSQVLNDPDGFTKHGVQTFRIEVQNT